jgi:hypothetical protein
MSNFDAANSSQASSINSAIASSSENLEEPIEAEIVENFHRSSNHLVNAQGNPSERKQISGDRVGSIVYQSSLSDREIFVPLSHDAILDGEYVEVAQSTTPDKLERNWLDLLATPWTMASMFLLLTANILLSYSQWSDSSQIAADGNSFAIAKPTPELSEVSSIKNLNLAVEKSDRLDAGALSLVAPSSTSSKTASVPPVPPSPTLQPTSNLTNVLLPPSLQPQPIQTHPLPPSLPVAYSPAPNQPSLPPPPPVAQTLPVPPSIQPVTENKPVSATIPTFSQKIDPISEFSQRHAAEQRRLEQENLPAPSFYQKTRIDRQAQHNQHDPSILMRQFQQLQREQVPNSMNGQLANPEQQTINYPQPTTYTEPSSGNNKPSVEINSDGSVEIKSNSLR